MNPRALRVAGPVLLLVAAVVSLVVALLFGGGTVPLAIGDPGAAVRWGLPVAQLLVNISAAGMVGSLVVALWALRPDEKAFATALDLASLSAGILTVASGATGFLSYLNAFNPQVTLADTFGRDLGRFLTGTELGAAWTITTVAAAVLTIAIYAVRGWLATLIVALAALAALVPMATVGHAGDLSEHNVAVSAMAMHIIPVAIWVGGLLALVVLRPQILASRTLSMTEVLRRYSSFALLAFLLVAASGVVRAAIALGSWQYLATPYGILVIAKAVLLLGLGLAGAMYRRFLIARTGDESRARPFWFLVLAELALMGLASGVAAGLSRTPPPVDPSIADRTPAEILTGSPLPPELTPLRWITEWSPDPIWIAVVIAGIFFYLAGVRRLRLRGDRWPAYRTVLWILGMLLLAWVTSGAVNAYGEYLFSVHMLGHMMLTMAIPLLLVPGAPVTLASRAIRKRRDGTRGGREWILWAVHTPLARVVTHPLFAAANFVVSLWAFYFTDVFRWALYQHLGHQWMTVHFLITGYIFVLSLVGADPVAYRLPYPGRLAILVGVMAMHAFFGVALMMHTGLMAAEWFGSMGRTWGGTPLDDQYVGGGIAWSVGEIPTVILSIAVGIQWSRSDDRAQRARDRKVARFGDSELEEYNARLAALAESDARERG